MQHIATSQKPVAASTLPIDVEVTINAPQQRDAINETEFRDALASAQTVHNKPVDTSNKQASAVEKTAPESTLANPDDNTANQPDNEATADNADGASVTPRTNDNLAAKQQSQPKNSDPVDDTSESTATTTGGSDSLSSDKGEAQLDWVAYIDDVNKHKDITVQNQPESKPSLVAVALQTALADGQNGGPNDGKANGGAQGRESDKHPHDFIEPIDPVFDDGSTRIGDLFPVEEQVIEAERINPILTKAQDSLPTPSDIETAIPKVSKGADDGDTPLFKWREQQITPVLEGVTETGIQPEISVDVSDVSRVIPEKILGLVAAEIKPRDDQFISPVLDSVEANEELSAGSDIDAQLIKQLLSVSDDNTEAEPAQAELTGALVDSAETANSLGSTQLNDQTIAADEDSVELADELASTAETEAVQPTLTPVEIVSPVEIISPVTPTLSGSAESPVNEPQVVTLTDEQVNAVVDHIVSPLSDTPESKSLAASLRADLSGAVAELAEQKSSGREPGIDLKRIVEQAVSGSDMDAEAQQLVIGQVNRTEQLISVSQTVVDNANQLAPAISALANESGQNKSSLQSHSEQALVSALDKMTSEVASQVGEQTKASAQNQAGLDKPAPIHLPEGQKQLAEKIRWMVGGRVTAAEIRLDPPELGSMQIRVSMAGDTASVSFVVQSAQARDMLMDAQPRLREMLSEQGIDLGESFVASEQQQQSGEQGEGSGQGGNQFAGGDSDDELTVIEQPLAHKQSPYNIDAYV